MSLKVSEGIHFIIQKNKIWPYHSNNKLEIMADIWEEDGQRFIYPE